MHRALIVSSKYDPASGYPDREAWRVSNRRLGLRLQQHGYAVERLEPGAGLVRKLREALATEDPLSAVVIVFSGYVLLTESREPAILLADEQVTALRLQQLCGKAGRTFGRVLVVLDGVRGSSTRIVRQANPHSPTDISAETLLARMALDTVRGDNTGMLVRIAPWGAADTVPDFGLCEQLSKVLEDLDDTHALSTPELELELLNRDPGGGAVVACRHSKPAFVFLPSRRFASEPPKGPPSAAASVPRFDEAVAPHVSRASLDDDRTAWTPPPGSLSAADATTTLVSHTHEPSAPRSAAAPSAGSPPPQPTPLPALDVPAPIAPAMDPPASQPVALTHSPAQVEPPPLPPLPLNPPIPHDLPTPPPLPFEQRAPAMPPELPVPPPLPFEQRAPAVPNDLGQPPPLPVEREPHPVRPMGTPPPLPLERLVEQPPVPTPQDVPPQVHAQPGVIDALHSTTHSLGVPPPLPATHSLGVPPPLPAERAPTEPAPAPSGPTLPEAAPSRSSHPSPPPRKQRDSVPLGAPSLPPPTVSPESWRPQAEPTPHTGDEAALLDLAQRALAANDYAAALFHAQQCLTSFPESAGALHVAASALAAQGNLETLAHLYTELVERQSSNVAAAQLCVASARLWATSLRDANQARYWLERGLSLDANNPSLQRDLADLVEQSGDASRALVHSVASLRLNPLSPAVAEATFARLQANAATELSFSVACLLSFLGHTTNHVSDLLAAHRSSALPKPARPLNANDYKLGLDVTHVDPELTQLLSDLAPFARGLALPKPKQQRQLLDELRQEDIERSTTMLARTFSWACQLLTVNGASLYLTEADVLPHLLPVDQTCFAVGKSLGRGLSLTELAFLWGRALAWYKPQTHILYSWPSTVQLSQLVRAGRVAAGLDESPGSETRALARALKKAIPSAQWPLLHQRLESLGPHFEQRLEQWKHAADRAANRIGLLACGDPELAARTLDRFPTTDGGRPQQQLSELWSFVLSDEYLELRRRLGVHLGG
jgi:tetratricopeptide (TPR) repeat protein